MGDGPLKGSGPSREEGALTEVWALMGDGGAVHTRHPKNIAELKQFCNEEWLKIPPEHCARSDLQVLEALV